jgi:nucleoside-diphosphate-sugar epimerase
MASLLLMRVLVTGGGGFIGSHLVERMLALGYAVVVLDNFSTGRRENLAPFVDDVEIVEGDVQSFERVHRSVRGCDVVLHEAALPSVPRSIQDPLTTNQVNVVGTLNVLLAARDSGVGRVVCASSSSIYGSGGELPKVESMRPAPISPYAVSKLAAEGYCLGFPAVYGVETVALRYFNVFGPRQDPTSQYSAVIPNFIAAGLDASRPVIFGDGEQSRDFTYVDNVVAANVRAMEAIGCSGEVFNVACARRISLLHLLDALGEILGAPVVPEHRPSRAGDVLHSLADITRARHALSYEPDVHFEEGLRRTVEWAAAQREAGSFAI